MIHKGWAPIKEKMKDDIKEDSRTSDTPYCCVDSIRCKENAIPGSTLTTCSTGKSKGLTAKDAKKRETKLSQMTKKKNTHFAKKTRAVAGITL